MRTRIRLRGARLHYEPGIQVFTAASGPIEALHEQFLVIEREDGFRGIGETRANITFLSKIAESEVALAIRRCVEALDWSRPPEAILAAAGGMADRHPALARAAVENALIEGIARRDGVTVAERLGGAFVARLPTNQCLFWSPDEVFDRLAARYFAEGFRDIKVRVAIGSFAQDLARLRRLRERFGDGFSLAIDANGAWTAEEAIDHLRVLEPLRLTYLEQPTTIGDRDAFERVGRSTTIPVMLDEGLTSAAEVDWLARLGPPFLAHLKIAKLGGPSVVMDYARRFRDAGIGVMMGQMNEGGLATLLAAHCAMAAGAKYNEVYGCYGLTDDPTPGWRYRDGLLLLPEGPGLGAAFDEQRTVVEWEIER